MSNINSQNPGQPSPDDKPAQSSSQKTDNLQQYFSSPNKRGPVEEVVSPPRKEGRFAKAKYYNRGKEEASKPKNEHTSPSPGRRRGGITRKKKVTPSLEIEEELANLGIDFNTTPGPEAWMPLELFDDRTCDDMTLNEWGEKLKIQPLAAKGLHKNGKQEWKEIVIFSYDESSEKFIGEWREDGSQAKLSRIFVCFYDEDSRKFAQRIADALKQRVYADSILRYNYYIDNMPVKDLSEITPEQEMRIEKLATDTRTLRDLKFDLRNLREEAEKNYARTMNKIIFDKYMIEHSKDLLPQRLELPQNTQETEEAPYYGLIQLPKSKETKEFTEAFKDFCLKSLFIKEEAVRASQEIHNKCGECLEKKLFYTAFSYPITIEDFKYQQENTYSQIVNYLQHGWVDEIVKISRAHFSQQGSGWFSVAPSRDTYDLGKLKKFLTMSKQMMQDVLLSMTRTNFEHFYQCIAKYVPDRVIIQGTSTVKNEFDHLQTTVSGKLETIPPLFYVDLIKPYMKEEFAYSALPANFVLAVTDVFDRTLNELAKIPDLEQKVLAELEGPLKAARFMKVPRKPQENPGETPDHEKYKFIVDENKWLYDVYYKLKDIMEKAVQPLEEYLKVYDPYKDILKINPDQYIRDLEQQQEQPKTEEDIKKEINEFKKKEEDLKAGIPDDMHISCFWVNCRELTSILAGKYSHMQKNLKGYIAKRARERTQKLQEIFKEMEKKILTQPENIEELTNLKEYLQQLPLEIEKVKVDINKCMDIYAILEEFQYPLSTDDLNKRWLVFGGPKDVMERVETRKQVLEKEKSRFHDEMVEKQEEFKENIENLERSVLGFHQFHKIEQHEEVAKMAASINESLNQFAAEAKTFNHHETLFGVEVTDYSKIQQLQKEFAPYSNLWITSNQWFHNIQHWLHCDWENLDAEEGERFVEEAVRTMGGVIRFFRDRGINQVLKIAEKVKAEIDEFRPKVPLMVALRKKGMKERHWQQISDKVGFTVQPEEEFTFSKALDMGLMKNVEEIVEIGERAAKEFAIEVMLNDMMAVWDKINFELLPFKQTWIIRGYDEINAILDEHIVQTQAMQFSPFKKPFEEKINDWNDRLLHMSTILEEWAKCQGQYMYLQPIFDSPDIAKQLPVESKKFKSVDSTWKFTLSTTKSIGNVLKVCSDEGPTEGLLTKIQEANASLEVIQKELNNYLERKREAFARFYFLSNDELLEILSQTKEPTAVQPHLRKVFENIYKVDFDADKIIHAMYSGEGEKVNFVKTIDPTKKNVEFWMGDLEEMMKVSVRDVLLNSIHDYLKTDRTKWVISHPGQCVLNGSQVHWTSEVETAIKQNKLDEYLEKSKKQISDLVRLIRTKLSAMQSITINALIVIDVHAKDVVEKLHSARIDDIGAFEWISQLRYYWEDDDCYVKCIQTSFPYGYEYLGNTLRLVITPLTDKCYMTLMGALKLNLGGAPAGPAGTGKTESTKDLAKALAKQCVVFNCSEGMDYTFVGKFFKGLASAGAWACFDEFNRINVEVLSVIAQQLLTLFGAKAREEKSIEFEGSNIKMNPTFCVFITMNPGYAGRTELPDNLKALFRPVAMMVPDYAMIGEIMLYSFGFDTARDLARKMVATFKLSSEQLSSQDHYDYGMRAVRSVINAAGLLKRAEPDMDEQQLLLRALRDVNVPKFLKDDLPLFENIISDLFPDIERPQINYGDLLDGIKRACAKHNLQPTDPFIQKVLQLYDTIQVRHGLMIVGPTGGGKTANYKVLQDAMGILAKENKGSFTKVETHILNPKSITMGQLYGWINESTKEWTDGILAYMVRETVKDVSGVKHWVMFDGPVDALWIESMNTVLDDNKKLCLNSGQILVLTPYMTMMFEVEDLAVASPALSPDAVWSTWNLLLLVPDLSLTLGLKDFLIISRLNKPLFPT